jgi:multisubunit Na+/H+ antiporter MnhB subunit
MKKTIFAAAVVVLAGLLGGLFEGTHPFGIPGDVPMDEYFIVRAPEDRSADNVVTAMVFDYRGFDTLGEAAVLFTTITAIGALFRDGGKKE